MRINSVTPLFYSSAKSNHTSPAFKSYDEYDSAYEKRIIEDIRKLQEFADKERVRKAKEKLKEYAQIHQKSPDDLNIEDFMEERTIVDDDDIWEDDGSSFEPDSSWWG